jgi:DNA polymerase-1
MSETYKDKVVLVDAHALIHRAYHAMPNLTSKSGVPSGALFGLTNMLLQVINEVEPIAIVACYDLPKATFRHTAFDGYKQNRKGADEALAVQIEKSREVFAAFGIDIVAKEGYEADDCIGTLVRILKEENKSTPDPSFKVKEGRKRAQIIIVSGDMDTMQMVEADECVVWTLKKDTGSGFYFTTEEVFKKYGIYPKQIPDYKGLAGDSSDNIPGIKGIGDKTACQILAVEESLEKVYEAIKKGKNKEYFQITERMFNLLKDGEDEAMFSKALATINDEVPIKFTGFKDYNFYDHTEALKNLCDEYSFVSIKRKLEAKEKAADGFADFEKSTPDPSFNKEGSSQTNWSEEEIQKAKIMLWLLKSEETDAELDRIVYLTRKSVPAECLEYLEAELKKENLWNLYLEIELPLIKILNRMREVGIMVDRARLQKMLSRYAQDVESLTKEIYSLAGQEFNLNSPKQLGKVLYEDLGLGEKIKKTKGGQLSTRADVLEKLKDAHPIIEKILSYREREKMVNTYLEPLLVHSQFDDRIHSTLVQTGAATGRFSSTNPNMQNIPVRGEEGTELRSCFIAGPGKVILAADYSQIELRIAGMLSGDEYLVYVFNTNQDLHTAVASKMFHVEPSAVTKDMRRAAKAMNFGILYGMGVNSIKEDLQIGRKQAQEFYDSYTQTMYQMMKFLHDTIKKAKDIGYTETLYGRRRNIRELFSPIPYIRAQGDRIAMNAPIQGTSADIIKLAMIDFDKIVEEKGWRGRVELLLQIHDELLYEVDADLEEEVKGILKKTMESVLEKHPPFIHFTSIKIVVEHKSGKSWGEA